MKPSILSSSIVVAALLLQLLSTPALAQPAPELLIRGTQSFETLLPTELGLTGLADLAVAPDGHLYLVDNGRLIDIDPITRDVRDTLATAGPVAGNVDGYAAAVLGSASQVAVGGDGFVYYATGGDLDLLVVRLDPTSGEREIALSIPGGGTVRSMSVDGAKALYVATVGVHRLYRMDLADGSWEAIAGSGLPAQPSGEAPPRPMT